MTRTKTLPALTALAIAATLGLALTACSGGTNNTPGPALTATATAPVGAQGSAPAETTATAAPAHVAPVAGDILNTVEQREAAEAAGLTFYPLPTGGIAVQSGAPLTEPLKAAIVADTQNTVNTIGADNSSRMWMSLPDDVANDAQKASEATGRKVIIVYPAFAGLDDQPAAWVWSSTEPTLLRSAHAQEDKIAQVQAFIAAQADAASYDVIVVQHA